MIKLNVRGSASASISVSHLFVKLKCSAITEAYCPIQLLTLSTYVKRILNPTSQLIQSYYLIASNMRKIHVSYCTPMPEAEYEYDDK